MVTKNIYDLSTYKFELPSELIAQHPVSPRDSSRLLVLDKESGQIKDEVFKDVIEYLETGDTLVLNETRVMPARLYGYKPTGAKVEVFLLKKRDQFWEALVRPAKRLKKGAIINFENSSVEVKVIEDLETPGAKLIQFLNTSNLEEFIEKHGEVPLPPYINRSANEKDKLTYQTIFANKTGSVAAPTAGLHFTDELFTKVQDKGINIVRILLHVGIGTFRPVNSADIRDHKMHYEYYEVEEKTAQLLNETKNNKKSIIAVGTTVVRTLETVYNEDYGFKPCSGETNKFIYPGFKFKAIDKLITNFHLPESSLLMLVAAFAGMDNTMQAYNHAVENKYRFFSYGDSMLIK
ncbi:S-adenosylmethionine:tRNA ribosyltransferase-isomerase [Candidatus Syntrophocurvum alkaliphilum]|uniref:S-adenosylmethionine:tRNA ribosyltransferase-isomerase n=1 Tax=Candidatus Syntrophocurvum alkaliphilum TaxID=2293317 RepID=A0A6I6DKY5_9FIRM|nr:tRNA preQ1(34) S-adenosylmethionine ribosyltransferase-isomerase QueA [Candidatus Syntrophocurvum alkaliphilum]QGT99911.1 S-adenosylmethionine:tRNA ribosyltransferase-isomerase [Candidatus Syntrophocurvum alkaliphilum]